MLWKEEEVDLHVQTYSLNHINAHIPNGQIPWRLIGFYSQPEQHQKHKFWRFLWHLHLQDTIPWLCIGDFNEILSSEEK